MVAYRHVGHRSRGAGCGAPVGSIGRHRGTEYLLGLVELAGVHVLDVAWGRPSRRVRAGLRLVVETAPGRPAARAVG